VVAELVPESPVAEPLVAARGATPPPAWLVDAGAEARPSVARAVAIAVAASGTKPARTATWAAGEARGVRVWHDTGRRVDTLGEADTIAVLDFVDFLVRPDGSAQKLREDWDGVYDSDRPRLVRDLDGDGRPDAVWSGCRDRIDGGDGARLAIAPSVCGC
jgi:hypothetical protein